MLLDAYAFSVAYVSLGAGIGAHRAATLQLTVPLMAAIGGVLLLGENLTARLVAIALVVLGGVAMALFPSGNRA